MSQIDLKKMTTRELTTLRAKVDRAIASREKRERKEALKTLKEKAREMGYSFNELIDGSESGEGKQQRSSSKPRKRAAPKYRHPENPDLTWSGRGRQPNWLKEAVANGVPMENFLIDKS
ncbi:H-NS histone family protein [Roseovarius spongiae]|uniref:H-NS histone family protein n=1 Tax=Roseovarius spongiae TaxID=2320272 RepID=A0A3A8AVL5_9RHOB|nr:H-NS histone family protein [Roseovarius spongiae]RKF16328.1 H-NS histone family protein [Roseovarius spongiae]